MPGNVVRQRLVTEAEVLFYLGPPDLMTFDNRSCTYVYFFDGRATGDCAVHIDIQKLHGRRVVTQIGWSATDAHDYSSFRPYSTTAPNFLESE